MRNKVAATRELLPIGVALSLLVCLTGCETVATNMGDLSIRRIGDELAVGVCGSLTATSVKVTTRDMLPWGFQGVVFAADGSAVFEDGSTFSTDGGAPGMEISESRMIDFPPIDEIAVYVDTAEPDVWMAGYFTLSEAGVPEDGWLHSDGRVTSEAC